jgi:hypothetical protein
MAKSLQIFPDLNQERYCHAHQHPILLVKVALTNCTFAIYCVQSANWQERANLCVIFVGKGKPRAIGADIPCCKENSKSGNEFSYTAHLSKPSKPSR